MSEETAKRIRIGSTGPACIIDGETDPAHLEHHSIGGVRIVLCRSCYGDLIEKQSRRPAAIWDPPDDLERIGHALLAEADLLATLAQTRWVFGYLLIDRVRREAPDQEDTGNTAGASQLNADQALGKGTTHG